jgi:uncharacterized protein YndB with AHSA1/START domain
MSWWLILILILGAAVGVVVVGGALTPANHVARLSARYGRPPQQVFDAITAFDALPSWREDVRKVELLPQQDGKPMFREHAEYGVITYAVELSDPPRKLVLRIADDSLPFGGTWTYELTPDGTGTRLSITEDGFVKNVVFRFLSRWVFSQTATMDRYLRALGRKFGEQVEPA